MTDGARYSGPAPGRYADPMTTLRKAAAVTAMTCVLVGALASGLAGCAGRTRHPAVPQERTSLADVPGFTDIRWWGDVGDDPTFLAAARDTITRERAYRAAHGEATDLASSVAYLAVSGGGEDGAFGAGLLCGWTDAGTRPDFCVVTGVSTGALIAPFAFAGPEYDHVLREVYTTVRTSDILVDRGLLSGLFSDAMADTRPLRNLLEKYVDDAFVEELAHEYATGDLLLIATTDLDAGRSVVWNIGAIASSDNPRRREFIISLMLASSAIPGFFPPVLLDVPIEGTPYQEMHVDGGTSSQIFIFPPGFRLRALITEMRAQRERTAYVLRNGRLDPQWAETQPQTLTIAQRAISNLIQSQGLGDLYRIYMSCRRDGVKYKLAFIPPTFREPSNEPFDPVYMGKLFDVGYELGKTGTAWHDTPPGFEDDATAKP